MFETLKPRTRIASAAYTFELIYHNTVRSIRKTHGNAFMALFTNIFQTLLMVGVFYIMSSLMGFGMVAAPGDFLVYIMTGIFLFMTHIKTVGAVSGSEGPASAMMQHAPMTTAISIASALLSTLYIQVLSLLVTLFFYDVLFNPYVMSEIYDKVSCLGMLILAWFSGGAIGLVFLAIKPWAPSVIGLVTMIYQRANMIASGKMFLANMMPPSMIVLFDWNPLFHVIDQARGYAFINYSPRHSDWEYTLYVGIIALVIGMMGEFYTRKHASASWGARG